MLPLSLPYYKAGTDSISTVSGEDPVRPRGERIFTMDKRPLSA